LCAKTAELHCGNHPACIAFCTEYGSLQACVSQLADYVACAKPQPISHWECDVAMVPALKAGYCDKERQAFAKCVSTKRPR
jgi:hypothetical protein